MAQPLLLRLLFSFLSCNSQFGVEVVKDEPDFGVAGFGWVAAITSTGLANLKITKAIGRG